MFRSYGLLLSLLASYLLGPAQSDPFLRIDASSESLAGSPRGYEIDIGTTRRIVDVAHGSFVFTGEDRISAVSSDADHLLLGRSTDLSLELWAAVPDPPRPDTQFTILSKGDKRRNPRLLLAVIAGGKVRFQFAAGEVLTLESDRSISDGEWHHIAVVLDRDHSSRLYIDGKAAAVGAATQSIDYHATSPLSVGASYQAGSSPRRFFQGFLDDVALYDRVLSDEEIGARSSLLATRVSPVDLLAAAGASESTNEPPMPLPRQRPITDIVDGNAGHVVSALEQNVRTDPDDLESLFLLAMAQAQTGELEAALQAARLAVERGIPKERFLAGPRDMLEPLYETGGFRALFRGSLPKIIHGPMLGSLTSDSVTIWVRTWAEERVDAVATIEGGNEATVRSSAAQTTGAGDYTAVVQLSGLEPGSTYRYRLRIGEEDVPGEWRFTTLPASGTEHVLTLAFGGGAGFNPQAEYMWETIRSRAPQALLLLGDNVYIDDPLRPDVQRYFYYRRQSRPEFRTLVSEIPVYAIWDDHDFGINDRWGGPEIDVPEWKRPVYRLFRRQWNNPEYGGGDEHPGCYFSTRIGPLDVIMLDGRYYREYPGTPSPSMLGAVQKEWLFEELRHSNGTFKLLVSPVPWAKDTNPGSTDTWDGFAGEREEIFDFIEQNQIEGVILISADRHRSDIWRIERPKGYDFFEFESSRLTNSHRHGTMKQAIFSYNTKNSFGLLRFDLARNDPTVTYSIVNIDGETVYEFSVNRSDLEF